jgi:hypothetical protein
MKKTLCLLLSLVLFLIPVFAQKGNKTEDKGDSVLLTLANLVFLLRMRDTVKEPQNVRVKAIRAFG